MLAGGTMVTGGALTMGVRSIHQNAMRNRPMYAKSINKFANSDIYRGLINPAYVAGNWFPPFRKVNVADDMFKVWRKPGIRFPTGVKASSNMFSPLNVGAKWSNKYVAKVPMLLPFLYGASMTQELQQSGHSSGLAVGAIRTTASLTGMAVGQTIGAIVGSAVPVVGTAVGAVVGAFAGGMAGDQVVDIVKWMKSKGRQWTHPDLGGSFKDSIHGQTMRQRSLNAIYTSQFNIRSNLGNEAIRLTMGI